MPALAITDTNCLFGALEFSEKLAKEGVQPIIGIQLTIDFGDGASLVPRGGETGASRAGLVLLAKDEAGYRNLMRLASRAWLDPAAGDLPHVAAARFASHCEGLIALTGGPEGALDRSLAYGRPEVAERRLELLKELFADRLYVELQRHGLPKERAIEPQLLDLGYRHSLPFVATNEAFFAVASDYEAHDALLCIADGTVIGDGARRRLSPEHYFKTRAEMRAAFADMPEALKNSVEIALRCAYRPLTRKPILPRFASAGTQRGRRRGIDPRGGSGARCAAQGAWAGAGTD